jgi:hypothetical protein
VADDYAALDAHIARIRALPELARRAAPEVAAAVKDDLQRQVAAGVDPDGRPWERTEDGRTPLVGAEVFVGAVGSSVILRLRGHIARHHLGRARGGKTRRIIPTAGIPPRLATVITKVLSQQFDEAMHG